MRCTDVERLCTAYVDGELDERRASAVRGHMRTCGPCLALVQDEAAIASAAESLEPADPPAALWARIEQDLGQREIDDSRRSGLWLAWPRVRQAALPLAVAAAATLAVVTFGMRGGDSEPGPTFASPAEVTPAPGTNPGTMAAVPAAKQFRTVRATQIQKAELEYLKTIADLETMVNDVRSGWKAEQTASYLRAHQAFRAQVVAARNLLADRGASAAITPKAHDPLFAAYQGRIRFLQRVSFGEAM